MPGIDRGAARRAGEKTVEKLVDEFDDRIARRQP
jgi:hypothetical protein